jgi:16S rRNA processing protein RimM
MKPRYVAVGRISSPHGVDGSVKVISLTDFKERFQPATRFFLAPPLTSHSFLTIERVESRGDFFYIKFKEIGTRSEAEELKGRYLQVPRSESPKLSKDSYWIYEIIGLKCYTVRGKYLGVVEEVMKTGSNDVYLVRGEGKEILIPAIKSVVKEVNLEKGRIIISSYPGLLEEE